MSERSNFSRAEWALLADAPLAAATAVALAEEGGGHREAAAIISGWREAAREYAAGPLISALAVEMDPEDREHAGPRESAGPPPSFDQICDEAVDMCLRAVELLEARAPTEVDDYKAFVMHILGRVATAAGGGLLGGERVSPSERSVMREIAAALRYRG